MLLERADRRRGRLQALRHLVGTGGRPARRLALGGRRRVLHADRPLGLRQVHAARHARRPRGRRCGARRRRRAPGGRSRSAARGHRLPGPRPLPVADHARERGVRPRAAGRARRAPAPGGHRPARPARPARLRGEVSARAVGRHAAASRHRPRPRHRHAHRADGRTLRRPRRADPRADGGVAARHLAAHAQDGRLRHPQPARGARPLHARGRDDRPAGSHQERAGAADAVSARHGVRRAGGAAREAVERHPRRVVARDAVVAYELMNTQVLLIRAAILVGLLGAWEIAGRLANPLLYVPPSAAVPALGRLLALHSYPDLAEHLLLTLREIVVAYGLAIAAGLGGGFALGFNRLVGRAYGPILAALYAVPAVVWYPSLMLFFGLDAASKIAFGFLLGFFPITLAVLAGVRQVNPHLVTVARAYGAGTVTVFRRVMLPSMLFTLVGGLRTGLALCVIGVIVGEILGSKAGMGALINHAYGLLRTGDYVAMVLVTLTLVVGSDVLASLLERKARAWTE